MLRCVRVRGDDQRCPARPRRTARCAQAYSADRRRHWRASPRRSRAAVRAAHAPGRDGCDEVRGVCPILILVNCLQKEHPA
ncbi:hypothetical protein A4R29_05900 [Mesorhizobium ciceri biovar biserrulae]|nr:hypothetical protein A4R29_05900 [Mesorhizobium ciceri biovar biserrulae]